MGYILQLVPLLSMQDSNLQLTKQKRYSHIDSLQYINKQSNFEKDITRKMESSNSFTHTSKFNLNPMPSSLEKDLAKEIAQVTGKGRIINYYI